MSDTNYGWGPNSIGDRTDIGNWREWFRDPSSPTYLTALYGEGNQHSDYSRRTTAPAGENRIVPFKSCFPNSDLKGSPGAPIPAIGSNPLVGEDAYSDQHTVANAKGIYLDLLEYFRTRSDKLFVAVTAPPLADSGNAANARSFNNWLVRDWLRGYPLHNVAVLDFYDVLTTNGGSAETNDLGTLGGNHHRVRNGAVEHLTHGDDDAGPNLGEYSQDGDDHPSTAGNLKAMAELVPLLNVYYHCWQGSGGCPGSSKLGNISTRAQVLNGEDILIGGFIVGGRGLKQAVVAGLGPSLADSGVSGVLADPVLSVFSGQTPLANSDDWQQDPEADALTALELARAHHREAATRLDLPAGGFTALLSGRGGGTGVGQVAVWDAGASTDTSGLVNISSRARVGTGEDVMIAGFVIYGSDPLTLVVRALGPSLQPLGVADPLDDSELQLFSGSTLLATNDDWGADPNAAVVASTGFAPAHEREAAVLLTLEPGAYTVVVRSHDGDTGVGLVAVDAL